MEHSFNTDIAIKFGIAEAILFKNISFWVKKNRANNENYYANTYWTYNSIRAYKELFPYLTTYQVRRALKHLIDTEMIEIGNFNKSNYDRTSWYSIGKEGVNYIDYDLTKPLDNLETSIIQNQQMEYAKTENEIVENNQPIPYINTYINTNNKQQIINKESKKESKEPEFVENNPFLDIPFVEVEIEKEEPKKKSKKIQETETYNQVIDRLVENKELNEILKEWVKSRLFRKEKFTNKAIELNVKRLMKMPEEKRVVSVEDSIINGWKGIFEHKEKADSSAWLEEKKKENELKAKELDLKEKNQPYYQKQIEMQSGKVEEKQQGKESQDKSMALFTQYYDDYIKGNISKEKLQELGMDESLFFQLDSDKENYENDLEMKRLKAEYERKWGKKNDN